MIHAAALASVAHCAHDFVRAIRVNTTATAQLALLSAAAGVPFVFVSTDLVFDGEHAPYTESASPAPLSVYGHTKAEAEKVIRAIAGHMVVARVSLLYGPSRSGKPGFFDQQIQALRQGGSIGLFEDEWRTPLDLITAARALIRLADSQERGIFHIGGPERMSRLEMGRRLAAVLNLDAGMFRPARRAEAPGEPRPRDVSLDCTRWRESSASIPCPRFEEAVLTLLANGN